MYIEYEPHPFSAAKHYADSKGIPSAVLEKKDDVLNCLLGKAEKKTLIISASNSYLFPARIVDHPNITIIYFHNALLPKYPGQNVASWVIYCAEPETGITWHYVSRGIDDGDIIVQKSCTIPDNINAYGTGGGTYGFRGKGSFGVFGFRFAGKGSAPKAAQDKKSKNVQAGRRSQWGNYPYRRQAGKHISVAPSNGLWTAPHLSHAQDDA